MKYASFNNMFCFILQGIFLYVSKIYLLSFEIGTSGLIGNLGLSKGTFFPRSFALFKFRKKKNPERGLSSFQKGHQHKGTLRNRRKIFESSKGGQKSVRIIFLVHSKEIGLFQNHKNIRIAKVVSELEYPNLKGPELERIKIGKG